MDDQYPARRHPAEELCELQCRKPYRDQSVQVWVAWFQRQADLWDEVFLVDASLTDTATLVGEFLRRTAKELCEMYKPEDQWPGAASW